jgi:hypothetical protein
MWRDPIVQEVRQLRQQYAARFNHDLKAICQDLRERQKKGGRKVVTLPPRPAQQFTTDGQPAT